jgi:dolichol-phosphate mannosyltransferase
MRQGEFLVFIPTYNERENVEKICSEILALGLGLDILFLDDNSSDGTASVLQGLAKKYSNVQVVFRAWKMGVGSAHLDGIRWAYDHGYKKLITMDCDFTHSPASLPDFISRSKDYDVVVGSRYLLKNSLPDWNLFRKFLTHVGHFMTRHFLNMKYDATGAFRFYDLKRIPRDVFGLVRSKGYSFFFESLYVLQINNFRIGELPIVLPARTYGHSKMSLKEALHSIQRLFYLYGIVVIRKKEYFLALPSLTFRPHDAIPSSHEWDRYWGEKNDAGGSLYDLVSAFYRKFIIRPSLNYFIGKHFAFGANLLHAGCGSGQVDIDVNRKFCITALDISPRAIDLYQKFNQNNPRVIRGDIFHVPFQDGMFDGVYNLGVLEHFTEEEIMQILTEFRRAIKPDGKILIFWPPVFGLSVRFLKVLHAFLRMAVRRKAKLYPDEITLAKSKEHIENLGARCNLKIVDYYFGPRDCFTQATVVFKKINRGGRSSNMPYKLNEEGSS